MDACETANAGASHINDTDESEENIGHAAQVKPVRLSLHLIVKRHLPKDAAEWSQEKIISELNKVKRVRLDRENIGGIDSLELFSTQVTNLYLQCNRINRIQNLECLPNLQVLVLSNNQIKSISGIDHLEKLLLLDLSENCLERLDEENLPKNIVILNLNGNPSLEETDYRPDLIQILPKLKQLDGSDISVKEKKASGVRIEGDESDDDEEEASEEEEEGREADEEEDGKVRDDSEKDSDVSSPDLYVPLVSGQPGYNLTATSSYKQLPKIESSIQGLAADMLLRSQQRLEDVAMQHKRHLQQITNIKIKSKIRPMPQISKPQ